MGKEVCWGFVKTSKKLDGKKSFSKEFVYGDLNVFGSYNVVSQWRKNGKIVLPRHSGPEN